MEIFADCIDDIDGGVGDGSDVPVVEFAIYLFILSIFRSDKIFLLDRIFGAHTLENWLLILSFLQGRVKFRRPSQGNACGHILPSA